MFLFYYSNFKNNIFYLSINVYIYFNKIFECLLFFFFKYFDNFCSIKNKIIRKKLIFVDANS